MDRLRELTEGLGSVDDSASDVALSLVKLDARALRERCDAIRLEMKTQDPELQKALLAELVSLERELRLLQPMRSSAGRRRA